MSDFFDYELSESYNKRICPNSIENLTHENLKKYSKFGETKRKKLIKLNGAKRI